MGVDVRGVEGVLTGSIGSSIGSGRSILRLGVGADTLLTGVEGGATHPSRGREVGCTLLRFGGTESSMCVSSSVSAEELSDWLVIFVA